MLWESSTAEAISSLDHCFGGRRVLIAFTKNIAKRLSLKS